MQASETEFSTSDLPGRDAPSGWSFPFTVHGCSPVRSASHLFVCVVELTIRLAVNDSMMAH
jgi:hypothetical protein